LSWALLLAAALLSISDAKLSFLVGGLESCRADRAVAF
jgi:hypothetical protein